MKSAAALVIAAMMLPGPLEIRNIPGDDPLSMSPSRLPGCAPAIEVRLIRSLIPRRCYRDQPNKPLLAR
jgi:hypothetical protein